MRPSRGIPIALLSLALARSAEGDGWDEGDGFSPPPVFAFLGASMGGVKPAGATPAHLTSSRIVAVDDGALVSDADSGMLVRTDGSGKNIAQLAIGSDAGLLAYDDTTHRAYVADRRGDRIVVVSVGTKLELAASWKTPAEPFGVALSPDRTTAFVTTIADRTLVAFEASTGRERWRATLPPEPRGLAVSPDGKRVLVASLSSGAVEQIALGEQATVRRLALPRSLAEQRARGAFAVTFMGNEIAVAPYQLEIPVAERSDSPGNYGGSFTPPISHHLAFLGVGREAVAETNVHEPRAAAWDSARDVLYVAGMASDSIVTIVNASQVDAKAGMSEGLGQRCGADGLAIGSGGTVLVWCSFTRTIVRFDPKPKGLLKRVSRSPELVPSTMSEERHAGLVLFHSANEHISGFGGMSCGNCHLEGRVDGLSWRIGNGELQTPMLAGRIANTAPYKWDGKAKDLPHSLRETIGRLGGTGLSKKDLAALTAFVETIPAVRAPTREAATVARGKRLFESGELGCTTCHDGSSFTDRERHELEGTTAAFDTPGLGGLAASAPYFHDGSAKTLVEVLRDRGRVHGMSEAATKLDDEQLATLIAYLESL